MSQGGDGVAKVNALSDLRDSYIFSGLNID